MHKEIIKNIKPEIEKTISFLENELIKIRAGNIMPSLIEDIIVDCFGQKVPLRQLAAISSPSPRSLVIQPWDISYFEGIVNAISNSGFGASPIVEKETIRLSFPVLSDEHRQELSRLISAKQEETRKTARKWREKAWDEIQEKTRSGEIREDDKFRAKDELQKLIDDCNKKIEEIGERKKKEIKE